MKKPFISIVTSTFNCVNSIEATIISVLSQSSDYIEHIIIDGGSNDGTVEIIKKYSDQISYWISEKDNGIYDAWNKGILKSKGSFISFLGAGDLLCSNYTKLFVDKIIYNNNIDFISSKMIIDNKRKSIYGFSWNWNSFRKSMNVVHPGAVHNKKLYNKYGMYDVKYKIAGDYEFLLRIGNQLKSDFIIEPTVVFGLDGISSNRKIQLAKEVRIAKIDNKARNFIMINFEFIFRVTTNIISKSISKIGFKVRD
jgi:glycosyltransferase involved in cell wall biosynthesis